MPEEVQDGVGLGVVTLRLPLGRLQGLLDDVILQLDPVDPGCFEQQLPGLGHSAIGHQPSQRLRHQPDVGKEEDAGDRVQYLQNTFCQTLCARFNIQHISLEQNLTIRSHDGGKEGHFCNRGDTSIHLPLTRTTEPSGQLSL